MTFKSIKFVKSFTFALIAIAICIPLSACSSMTFDDIAETAKSILPFGSDEQSESASSDKEEATDEKQESEDIDDDAEESKRVVMSVKGDKDTYVLQGEKYIEAGCQAFDKKSGALTKSVRISGEVDTSNPGDYEIDYAVVDADGDVATAKRTVHVVESFSSTAKKIPVMMYHYVYTEDDKPDNLNGNYLLDTKLEEHCKYLKDNDYYFPSYEELRAWVDGEHTLPAKSAILTFDDGQSGFFKYGVPVLEKYEVPATSFVIGTKTNGKLRKYASPYIQYQSHSYNMHRAGGGNIGRGGVIYAYSEQDIIDDIESSNKLTGDAVAFAYPFGDNDDKSHTALADAGILCAFTIINDKISQGDDPMALNRVRISGEYTTEQFKYLVSPDA